MPKGMPRFFGKTDTIRNESPKVSRRKFYEGRIKATKGLYNVSDPKVKAMSHRIVRRKLQRETQKEINNQ